MTYEFLKDIHQQLEQIQELAEHDVMNNFNGVENIEGYAMVDVSLMLTSVLGMIEREYENVNKESIEL